MVPIIGHWLHKRREAKRIDEALRVMSLKVFTQRNTPSLADMKAIGAWTSVGEGSKVAPVIIHAKRSTFGKITQQAWLTERFGQAPGEWTLVMNLVYGNGERRLESVRIQTNDGKEHVLHFDITEWFGLRR
jgi:hypothetical protein